MPSHRPPRKRTWSFEKQEAQRWQVPCSDADRLPECGKGQPCPTSVTTVANSCFDLVNATLKAKTKLRSRPNARQGPPGQDPAESGGSLRLTSANGQVITARLKAYWPPQLLTSAPVARPGRLQHRSYGETGDGQLDLKANVAGHSAQLSSLSVACCPAFISWRGQSTSSKPQHRPQICNCIA